MLLSQSNGKRPESCAYGCCGLLATKDKHTIAKARRSAKRQERREWKAALKDN